MPDRPIARSLLFLLGPVLAIACWAWLLHHEPQGLALKAAPGLAQPSSALVAGEYHARLIALATTILFVGVALAATFVAFGMLRSLPRLADAERKAYVTIWIVLGLVLTLALLLASLGLNSPRTYAPLGTATFTNTLGVVHDGLPLRLLHRALDAGDIAVAVGGTGLALAACAVARAIARCREDGDLETLQALGARQDQLLATGAALLVAGTIWTRSWHRWPQSLLEGGDAKLHESVAAAVLAYQSVCYVLILASLYLPLAWLRIRARTAMAPRRNFGDESSSPWGPGFAFGLRTLALIAPVLAGPFADLISSKILSVA
jgi:hypothetical protein